MSGDILVVDDDADLRETLQVLLDDSGYGVTAVANGQAALDQLKAGARPSLILLDLMMPEMNGWQFLERAQADAVLDAIPVVIMTARRRQPICCPRRRRRCCTSRSTAPSCCARSRATPP